MNWQSLPFLSVLGLLALTLAPASAQPAPGTALLVEDFAEEGALAAWQAAVREWLLAPAGAPR